MNIKQHGHPYGIMTIGTKGQVVIPAEARQSLHLKKGDKLLVFGVGSDMLALFKFSNLEKIASHLARRLAEIQKILDNKVT